MLPGGRGRRGASAGRVGGGRYARPAGGAAPVGGGGERRPGHGGSRDRLGGVAPRPMGGRPGGGGPAAVHRRGDPGAAPGLPGPARVATGRGKVPGRRARRSLPGGGGD